jgi:2-keto-4-pentenoate hydratase
VSGRGVTRVVRDAAARLEHAAATGVPCAPVRDLIGTSDVELAYAVQQVQTDARLAGDARIVGRKIGLTSPAVQRQLGVDQPDFGVLFADMEVPSGQRVPSSRLIQPRAEAEVAFVLGRDLPARPCRIEEVRAAVGFAAAAIEIVDSRVRDWDISLADTVADNASSGLFVLGTRRVPLSDLSGLSGFEPVDVTMSMTCNGAVVSAGNGSACLGDPLKALSWLTAAAHRLGFALHAGDVVLSGALGPMVPVGPGDQLCADLTGLGRVSAFF